jgi:hypothetical protein
LTAHLPAAAAPVAARSLFNPFGHIPCDGNRAEHLADRAAPDDRERHLDIQFAPVLVRCARERGTALKVHRALGHCRVVPPPMRGAQTFGNDQVEALSKRFVRREAE